MKLNLLVVLLILSTTPMSLQREPYTLPFSEDEKKLLRFVLVGAVD